MKTESTAELQRQLGDRDDLIDWIFTHCDVLAKKDGRRVQSLGEIEQLMQAQSADAWHEIRKSFSR